MDAAKNKSGGRLDADSSEATATATTTTAAAAGTGNGIAAPAPAATVGVGASDSSSSPAASVQATYRQLPDEDVNWQARNSSSTTKAQLANNKMGKQNGGKDPEVDDGAQERMLKDDLKLSVVPSNASEVQFRSENGDTKINMETVKQCLSGMSKQELMKYANDPFWIKLRWFLFITFWLLWAAMLAGAVAIVVMAPKCAPPPPRKWWEQSPIVRLSPSDTSAKSLSGLESLLATLQEQHVKAISLHSILQESSPGHVEDFRSLNPSVGNIEDFKNFVKAAAAKEQNVILEIEPNHSSIKHPWFEKSVRKEEPYTSYYVWADGKVDRDSRVLLPPNNWVSVYGGSAWTFNNDRKQYYLHQFNESQPDFNFTNPAMIIEFSEILKYWLNLGVKGFSFTNTRFLVEDSKLSNDSNSPTFPAEKGEYQSLIHLQTRDHPDNSDVMEKWRNIVTNFTSGDGLFTLGHGIRHDALPLFHRNESSLIDLPQDLNFLSTIDPTITAKQLNDSIYKVLNFTHWPGIDWNGNGPSLRKRMNAELADNFILMTMLLPATPILKMNDTISAKDAFAKLAEVRKDSVFQYGKIEMDVLNNETVFVYTRMKSGNPGYLLAFNTASHNTTIDVSHILYVPEEVNVVTHSQNYRETLDVNKKLSSNSIPLSSKSTLVVSFIPKQ